MHIQVVFFMSATLFHPRSTSMTSICVLSVGDELQISLFALHAIPTIEREVYRRLVMHILCTCVHFDWLDNEAICQIRNVHITIVVFYSTHYHSSVVHHIHEEVNHALII